MGVEFTFTNEYRPTQTDEIVDYLRGPRLWIARTHYPDHFDWLDKAHTELKTEAKRAMIALDHGQVCGVIIYQEHKTQKGVLELKNLTVRPDLRGRYIASFLLRNTEIEGGDEFGADSVICDAKASNFSIGSFLLKQGYRALGQVDLYNLKAGDDIIYNKKLRSHILRV